MQLDAVQLAAQKQPARQSGRYGKGHILENVADAAEALTQIPLPAVAAADAHRGQVIAGITRSR